MRSLLIVVLLAVLTLSTSFLTLPMKPAAAQNFVGTINSELINRCSGDFVNCLETSTGSITPNGPINGQGTIDLFLLNECTGSDDPANPTTCANTAAAELLLSASDQAFIESTGEQLTEQTNTCIAGA